MEDIRTNLYSIQTRHIARNLKRPTIIRDRYAFNWSLRVEEREEIRRAVEMKG